MPHQGIREYFMSSILKALKKLEAEKSLQQEITGINISREILRQQPDNRKTVLWFSLAAIVALAIIATLTTLLLRKPAHQDVVQPLPVTPVPTIETTLPPASGAVVPSPSPVRSVQTAPSLSITPQEKSDQQIKQSVPPLQPAINRTLQTELPDDQIPAQESIRTERGSKPSQPATSEMPDNALTLSGIAWNKDSSERLAIINGQPAAIGATISGVVIEEIMPDRVKVTGAGRSFELFLGKPAKSN